MADKPEKTKAELKVENEAIQARVAQLKGKRNALQREYEEVARIQQLQIENTKLTKEIANTDSAKIQTQIEDMEYQKELVETQNKKLTRQKKESENLHDGVNMLTDQVWKPLEALKAKFEETDKDGSGTINRKEFMILCAQIDRDLRVSPIYSMLDQHSASSVYANDKPSFGHNTGTIDSTQGWSAATNDVHQWYQIDCVVPVRVGGVLMQGRYNADQWITSFQISHSLDGVSWTKLNRTYDGNHDRDSKETIIFDTTIQARYIRIHPTKWFGHISCRIDLLWAEDFDEKQDEEKGQGQSESSGSSDCEFSIEEQNKLFNLFDLKKTGKIDCSEFLAVLDREAIRNPRQHPHQIIKHTMKYLLYGKVNVKEEYKLEMLGKTSKGFRYAPGSKGKCCVCGVQDGIYGFTSSCEHVTCIGCLRATLKNMMDNGDFPVYCMGCKQPGGGAKPGLDKLFNSELLRFWVDEQVIDVAFACRMWRAQNRVIQELQFEDLMKTSGMRKCPNCGLVILKNEGCNWFKCTECATEICYQTGMVAGKGAGKCGGGHNCHY